MHSFLYGAGPSGIDFRAHWRAGEARAQADLVQNGSSLWASQRSDRMMAAVLLAEAFPQRYFDGDDGDAHETPPGALVTPLHPPTSTTGKSADRLLFDGAALRHTLRAAVDSGNSGMGLEGLANALLTLLRTPLLAATMPTSAARSA